VIARRAPRLLAALLTGVLAGCSGGTVERYCEVVAEEQETLSDAAAARRPGALLEAVDSLHRLEEAAPSDLGDEWALVVDRVEELRAALADAGVDPASYDPQAPPEGLSEGERTAITGAAVGLADPATLEAVAAVEQQALDVCRTPLGL
jgi:hypothetical protein